MDAGDAADYSIATALSVLLRLRGDLSNRLNSRDGRGLGHDWDFRIHRGLGGMLDEAMRATSHDFVIRVLFGERDYRRAH